jgi:hypothetical protein
MNTHLSHIADGKHFCPIDFLTPSESKQSSFHLLRFQDDIRFQVEFLVMILMPALRLNSYHHNSSLCFASLHFGSLRFADAEILAFETIVCDSRDSL